MTPIELLRRYKVWAAAGLAALLLVTGYCFLLSPPSDFPSGTELAVPKGVSLSSIAEELSEAQVVKHPTVLVLLLRIGGAARSVHAGTYAFKEPQNAIVVAYRLATGSYDLTPIEITFPEGLTVRDMAARVAELFPHITKEEFVSLAKGNEGYLFPDTYLFLPTAETALILQTMRENFDKRLAPLTGDIEASGRTVEEIITMASLLEKEGRTTEVRRTIAGILWDRLTLGMPLQTDAVFGYIFERETYSPSYADLKVESPYNTYLYKGLPPGPINNPGLDSIKAALNPIKTPYLYYLTDREGVMHYAVTYAEHQKNQNLHLK